MCKLMGWEVDHGGLLGLFVEMVVSILNHGLRYFSFERSAARIAPSPGNLALYAGLLLSCKKVASNFKYEWVKYYNARLQHIVKDTCFRPLPVERYGHAAHLRILVTHPGPGRHVYEVPAFMEMTRFYTLRLSYPAHGLTVAQFFSSDQALQPEALQSGVASSGATSRVDFRAQEIHCSSTPISERQHSQYGQHGSLSDHGWRLTLESHYGTALRFVG